MLKAIETTAGELIVNTDKIIAIKKLTDDHWDMHVEWGNEKPRAFKISRQSLQSFIHELKRVDVSDLRTLRTIQEQNFTSIAVA